MTDHLTGRWHHQQHEQKTSELQGDHAMDGAFKFHDNKVSRAKAHVTSEVPGRTPGVEDGMDTRKLPGGYGDPTQTDQGYGIAPTIVGNPLELEVMCGPLLNYKGMDSIETGRPTWYGSVLVVAKPGQYQPELRLRRIGAITHGNEASGDGMEQPFVFRGERLYADPVKTFWRFNIALPLGERESLWEYTIPDMRFLSGMSSRTHSTRGFVVPAASQSMRLMFHSCNGFSVGTDEDAFSGPALWNDVMRMHEQKPFHVMIGGGDQIYMDSVRVDGPLKAWTSIGNPVKRRDYPFNEQLRRDCDEYYFNHYVTWFSTESFASANGQIPQVNIWDDHDIIDGFGSYTDHFMQSPVFRGIGGVSFKYYCLFQHHIPPPKSTYTTDAPQTTRHEGNNLPAADPVQLKDTFVLSEKPDRHFIVGNRPGPYVEEHSRSLYMQLGARVALMGIDARTERTRHQVNYPDTYGLIFERVERELSAFPGSIKHLIVLLGIPIAYPRLAWLENLFSSPLIAPIRLLNKRFGLAGGFFNHFDGQVDLLDDLDDHYTAHQHKKERKELLLRLQAVAKNHNVRITILGGDVHLAAIGRFYAKPKLNIPAERDYRYMTNVISSAITNKPPPKAVANLLARRNKIHHLDHDTDETLIKLFDKDPGASSITANFNRVTMPSRNYAIIQENEGVAGAQVNGNAHEVNGAELVKPPKDGHEPLHAGEMGAGTQHVVASGFDRGGMPGGLDVCLRVEIDQHDREGKTQGYGFSSRFHSLSYSLSDLLSLQASWLIALQFRRFYLWKNERPSTTCSHWGV